jgi:hypothetical protein
MKFSVSSFGRATLEPSVAQLRVSMDYVYFISCSLEEGNKINSQTMFVVPIISER